MSELVGRAVEAAARAELLALTPQEPEWEARTEDERESFRASVRLIVEVALGVVADHCTTEAERVEAASNGVPGAVDVAAVAAKAFREVAAELRETP